VIKFLCPNGHPLSAPENLAGKPGKCPKCNTAFVVPKPDEAAPAGPPAPAGGPPPELAAPASTPAAAASSQAAAPEVPAMGSGTELPAGEVFVFLCPNGHKLNGPPSMKGKPGQCPHCGARFRIPTDEDIEEAEEEVPTGEADDEEIPQGQPDEEGVNFNQLFGGEGGEEVVEATVEDAVAPPPPGPTGLGYIVGRLWERRTEQTELEIFLGEGEIVAPDFYSEVLSSSDYGVFAIQEGDGSFAVTVIPWNTVRRIGMRRIGDLPESLFG
jgi:hypothetical protein